MYSEHDVMTDYVKQMLQDDREIEVMRQEELEVLRRQDKLDEIDKITTRLDYLNTDPNLFKGMTFTQLEFMRLLIDRTSLYREIISK